MQCQQAGALDEKTVTGLRLSHQEGEKMVTGLHLWGGGEQKQKTKKEIAMPADESSGVQRGGEVEGSIGVARGDTRAWAHAVSSGCPPGDETFALGKGGLKG